MINKFVLKIEDETAELLNNFIVNVSKNFKNKKKADRTLLTIFIEALEQIKRGL